MASKTRATGFGPELDKPRHATYWVVAYAKDDEDVPLFSQRRRIGFVPGQDAERLMLRYCHSLFTTNHDVWEVLVHQGPDAVPQSGDQVVARLCRRPFDQCHPLAA